MPLILLTILILYFLFILVLSLVHIDNHRVTERKLAVTGLLAAVVPLGMGLGKILAATGFPATVNIIGWLLWFFVPYIIRLFIYALVYLLRDRGQEGDLPVGEEETGTQPDQL